MNILTQPTTNQKYVDDVKDIFFELILNNPKPNGKVGNFSCGFLGSIWIDMKAYSGREYRIAWYNRDDPNDKHSGSKNYTRKNFSPCCQFHYEGDWKKEWNYQDTIESSDEESEEEDFDEKMAKMGFKVIDARNIPESDIDEEELRKQGYRCVDMNASHEGLSEMDMIVKEIAKQYEVKKGEELKVVMKKDYEDESSDDENFYDVQETE
jgi:hypothetical protein